MLAFEIEYLTGVAFAAATHDRGAAEWPPHPDRLFSALVCAWAEGGEDHSEAEALEWLERLPPPMVWAPDHHSRDVVSVFVPPNDMTVSGQVGSGIPKDPSSSLAVLPELRKNRQPRQFPAAVLPDDDRTVTVGWQQAQPTPELMQALDRIAHRVPYLGHSSSLVRMGLKHGAEPDGYGYTPTEGGQVPLRWVYPGRLAELRNGFTRTREHNLARKRGVPELVWRPQPGPVFAYRKEGDDQTPAATASVFGQDWIIFRDSGGTAPALEAFSIVAKIMRDALMTYASDPVPELLSGHAPQGEPSKVPHLAILPLADVGWKFSRGRLMGVALSLPRTIERERASPDRSALLQAIAQFERQADGAHLTLGELGAWQLGREAMPTAASLQAPRYCRSSRCWASATPVILDRFPKKGEGKDIDAIISAACVNIGLPKPTEIGTYKHSAIVGAPSAFPAEAAKRAQSWMFPRKSPLSDRPRIHVVLTFKEPVEGPVILGAGRFQGLGLCLPLEE